jgi:signal transduction histidine kinase/DNA-binding response OmpR family regulator/ligand-binding sensor domain-containing protein
MIILSLLLSGTSGIRLNKTKYPNDNQSFPVDYTTKRSRLFFLQNYSTSDYGHQPQNWAILQDKRGFIYASNNGGVLEYDGKTWRMIDVPNLTVRSMTSDDEGKIYIGGINEIGFLKPSTKGKLRYVSLIGHLKEQQKKFSTIYKAHSTHEGIYFRAYKHLFRWDPKKKIMRVWEPGYEFINSFECEKELFIYNKKIGLMQMRDDSLQLVPGCDILTGKTIIFMSTYDSSTKKLLIGTRYSGFYLYDGIRALPFSTEVENFIKGKKPYTGIRLSSGDFALATRGGGLFIFDSRGHVKHIFDKTSGLQHDNIKYVSQDQVGNLWLGMENGIAKIEYASAISFYNEKSGLIGSVLSVAKHQKYLFAGTDAGLFRLTPTGKFHPVRRIEGRCWSLLSIGNIVLTATSNGIWIVSDEFIRKIDMKNKKMVGSFYVLHQSLREPNRVWVGGIEGLVSLYAAGSPKNRMWNVEHIFEKISIPILTIVEDKRGTLWLGTQTEGVIRVDFPYGFDDAVVNRYDTSHGLPPNEINVFLAAGHVMFATDKGILRFDEIKQVFIPDNTLGPKFANGSRGVFRIAEDQKNNIWLHSNVRNIQALVQADGSYRLNAKPFLRMPVTQTNAIYPDPDGQFVWFANVDGLYCFDTQVKKNYYHDFSTLIRKVELINGKTLVYGGYRSDHDPGSDLLPTFEYKDRNLHFEFAAPFFEAESKTQFQFLLEGYDDNWSQWSSETQKDYTNLDSGQYIFWVQAKNIYEHLSSEATFQFKILPPWYKTWWAFSLYAIAASFGVFLIVKWRSGKLEREKQRLEQIVKERTKEIEERTIEINEKNIQLESQTVQLKKQSEKLKEMDKIKSRFFANISHEFRTPLTLIMGPLEQLIAACSDDEEEKKRKLTLMLRNAQRLLRLINQLLELSKLDSGKMKLQAEKINIISFLKGITDSFRFMAQQKELELEFHSEAEIEDITLYIDPRKMEDVMSNLLVNAFKFTPPGGKITVTVKRNLTAEENFQGGFVEISVCDTGPGIPGEQLAYIFDRFYQADATYEYHEKGSGIGLALSKELVELHHGTIEARSREGEGSAFIIRLPLGSEHLAPDEIVDLSAAQTRSPADSKIPDKITTMESVIEEEQEIEPETDLEPEDKTDETNIILVVEDSADMRTYIRGALELGYTVVDAKDGRDGIEKARVIIPDLIISDIMMPEADGYELCSVLKNDVKTSHIPIIMLTAKASEENILQGLETGADDYITKPFNTKILIARIKNLIDIRSQLQKNINRQMTLQPFKTSVSKIDQAFFHDLHEVINKNLSDEEFNVEQLCKKLYMGRTTLYRKVLALTGETPTDFIRSYRLKRGAELLKQNFGTVLEVAFEVGFSNSSYFAKCFKEKFHQLPSEYQAANKQ